MAAYSDIPPQPMQDLTNYTDDLPPVVTNGTLLDAVRMVLEQDDTPEWMMDMLSLNKYYRVKFKKRATVEKFINHMAFLTDNKENQAYTDQELDNLHNVVDDLTRWVDKRKVECLDDSHWPVSTHNLEELRSIYEAFPAWQNTVYRRVMEWYDRMLTIKKELERETSPERGLSMRDIFNSHIQYYQEQNPGLQVHRYVPQPSDTEMYADGNLNPPPLQSDTDIEYTVV